MNKNLTDLEAEQVLIGSILTSGSEIFFDIDAQVSETSFGDKRNRIIYSTIKNLINNEGVKKPDINSIVTSISTRDKNFVDKNDLYDYLAEVTCRSSININPFIKRVLKLGYARNLSLKLTEAQTALTKITGEESLKDIIALAESPIIEITNNLIHYDETIDLAKTIPDYIKFLHTEKPENIGIPTGYPLYDKAIGGGLRRPGIHLIGARAGKGKSFMGTNIALNIGPLGIPALYLDTELTKDIVMDRLLAKHTNVSIDSISSGLFDLDTMNMAIADLKTRKVHYHNISGKSHYEWISIIRRWLMKEVGFKTDGTVKDCLVVLDYVKLMDLDAIGDVQEYQYLGQVMTDLHNLAIKYNIAILSFCQLNRDGINNFGDGVIAGSDRLNMLCSSFTILADKTEDDMADDPRQNGDKKLIPVKCRFGAGLERGEYINLKTDLSKGRIVEGLTNSTNRNNKLMTKNKGLLDIDNDDDGSGQVPI